MYSVCIDSISDSSLSRLKNTIIPKHTNPADLNLPTSRKENKQVISHLSHEKVPLHTTQILCNSWFLATQIIRNMHSRNPLRAQARRNLGSVHHISHLTQFSPYLQH